jgi:predicted phage tail protein
MRTSRIEDFVTLANMTIGGSGGGMKGGGGGGSSVEAPNNLRSRQLAKVIDLISEGPILGIVGGMTGIFLDGVALQNANGTLNFTGASVQWVRGIPAQPIMNGFSAAQAESAVALPLKKGFPLVRHVSNTDTDRLRITVSTPTLQHVDKDSGDINGTTVKYRIECQNDGGGYKLIGDFTISGKTNNNYQKSVLFMLPAGGPWDVRVQRLTADSTVAELMNDLVWDSYTEIIDDRVNYTNSACVGLLMDAEQFHSIPKRIYLVDGILMLLPSNYTDNRTSGNYSGVWDGTFKHGWSCNPAWIIFDLITQNRYGLGQFVKISQIDKWAFYKIGIWCDGLVDDGHGGLERRWTCNVQITSQEEAFDLVAQFAAIFRGTIFWAGGLMVGVADQPDDPVYQFTNANVIDGLFNYSGVDIRGRHTMITVGWNDPESLGERRFAIVEDQDAIARLGIQELQVNQIGCTSESMAIRTGNWTLFTEQYEAEVVTFSTGLEATRLKPWHIVRIADASIAGKRYGGRVGPGATTTTVPVDQFPPIGPNSDFLLSCLIGGDAHVETRLCQTGNPVNTSYLGINPTTPFSAAPVADTVWVLNDPGDLEPTLWRILGIKQQEADRYELTAQRHLPSKWDYVEKHKALTIPDITDIVAMPPPVQLLQAKEYLVQTSPISVGVRVVLSWNSVSPSFDVYLRPADGNWSHTRTDAQAIDLPVTEGPWEFQVTPIGTLGIKGKTSTLKKTIIGRFAPPAPPKQLRINVVEGVALFSWLPATEIDVIVGGHFELRHSMLTTGATWNTAQIAVPSIPGTASSVEAGYQPGTWMLRTFDIVGTPSATWATVLGLNPDSRYTQWVRICENPDYLGSRQNTEVMLPQEWLIIGATGGLWDAQTPNMDTWADVDLLPATGDVTATSGSYYFSHRIDAGGPFSVRLSSEILAFPFNETGDLFDDRMEDIDTWTNFDDTSGDYDGQVTLMIRSTETDPTLPGVLWSDWRLFISGEHYGRAWEFRADLSASAGQNVGVETLCIQADLRSKIDAGEDIPYPAAQVHIDFAIKFFLVPAVVITVQDASNLDDVKVINKTTTGFDVTIKQGAAHQVRTFDWHAQGY